GAVSAGRGLSERTGTSSAAATALATTRGLVSGARSTNRTLSPKNAVSSLATASATVVFPIPPGPTIVISRYLPNCATKDLTTSVRPIIRTSEDGRLYATSSAVVCTGEGAARGETSATKR